MLVSTNDGGINVVNLPIKLASGIGPSLHRIVDAVPDTSFDPPVIPIGDAGALAIALGQILPGCAGSKNPENAVDGGAMVQTGSPTFGAFTVALRWEQWLEALPLLVS